MKRENHVAIVGLDDERPTTYCNWLAALRNVENMNLLHLGSGVSGVKLKQLDDRDQIGCANSFCTVSSISPRLFATQDTSRLLIIKRSMTQCS